MTDHTNKEFVGAYDPSSLSMADFTNIINGIRDRSGLPPLEEDVTQEE